MSLFDGNVSFFCKIIKWYIHNTNNYPDWPVNEFDWQVYKIRCDRYSVNDPSVSEYFIVSNIFLGFICALILFDSLCYGENIICHAVQLACIDKPFV